LTPTAAPRTADGEQGSWRCSQRTDGRSPHAGGAGPIGCGWGGVQIGPPAVAGNFVGPGDGELLPLPGAKPDGKLPGKLPVGCLVLATPWCNRQVDPLLSWSGGNVYLSQLRRRDNSSPFSLGGRRLTVGLALLFLVMTAQAVVGPTPVQARCAGVNRPVTSTLGVTLAFVTETPATGTCNNNNTYTGSVKRLNRADVGMAGVWIQNGGRWSLVQYTNSTTGATYSFSDNNSNSFMTLCWYEAAAGAGTAHCGWGATYGPVGTTPGSRPDIYNQSGYHGVVYGF
jgi:hypothetical protein